jgi:hypothetical protein
MARRHTGVGNGSDGSPWDGQNGGKNFKNGYNPCQFLMKEDSAIHGSRREI